MKYTRMKPLIACERSSNYIFIINIIIIIFMIYAKEYLRFYGQRFYIHQERIVSSTDTEFHWLEIAPAFASFKSCRIDGIRIDEEEQFDNSSALHRGDSIPLKTFNEHDHKVSNSVRRNRLW